MLNRTFDFTGEQPHDFFHLISDSIRSYRNFMDGLLEGLASTEVRIRRSAELKLRYILEIALNGSESDSGVARTLLCSLAFASQKYIPFDTERMLEVPPEDARKAMELLRSQDPDERINGAREVVKTFETKNAAATLLSAWSVERDDVVEKALAGALFGVLGIENPLARVVKDMAPEKRRVFLVPCGAKRQTTMEMRV